MRDRLIDGLNCTRGQTEEKLPGRKLTVPVTQTIFRAYRRAVQRNRLRSARPQGDATGRRGRALGTLVYRSDPQNPCTGCKMGRLKPIARQHSHRSIPALHRAWRTRGVRLCRATPVGADASRLHPSALTPILPLPARFPCDQAPPLPRCRTVLPAPPRQRSMTHCCGATSICRGSSGSECTISPVCTRTVHEDGARKRCGLHAHRSSRSVRRGVLCADSPQRQSPLRHPKHRGRGRSRCRTARSGRPL